MNYFHAIRILKPDAAFQMKDQRDYSTLVWDEASNREYDANGKPIPGTEIPIPTEAECQAIAAQADAAAQAETNDRIARTELERMYRKATRMLVKFAGSLPSAPQALKDLAAAVAALEANIQGDD